MNKIYVSPELEIVKFRLSSDILNVSQGEVITSGGDVINPTEDEEEELIGN